MSATSITDARIRVRFARKCVDDEVARLSKTDAERVDLKTSDDEYDPKLGDEQFVHLGWIVKRLGIDLDRILKVLSTVSPAYVYTQTADGVPFVHLGEFLRLTEHPISDGVNQTKV